MTTHAIHLTNLTKHFGATRAIDGLSFAVDPGEVFGFLGPNGAGKTATIRCLLDFYRPTAGTAELFGLNSNTQGVAVRHRIGYMPATTALNEKWTSHEHFTYASALRQEIGRAAELAQRFQLDLTKTIKQLSTGNRQKVSLVLAFMFPTDLIILDEPTNGLDPLLQQVVYELIRETHERGATVFMSSHNLAEVEKTCSRVAVLRAGKLVSVESMAGLRDKHLYTISIEFSREYQLPALSHVHVVQGVDRSLTLKAHGDIQPLLNLLATAPVHDVQIQHASLEELFLEFYTHPTS